jgi:hypothetical protein
MGAALSIGSKILPLASNAIPILGQFGGGGAQSFAAGGPASFLAKTPDASREASIDAEGGGQDINALSLHFAEDIQAMDQASQQGTVSPEEWHSFYTCLYRLVTTVHDPGHDQGITSAIHALTEALHGTEYDEFTSEDAINAAHKFIQGHIGLHILVFLSLIDEGTELDFSADPEVEETLRTGTQLLSQAEDQLEDYEGDHENGQQHDYSQEFDETEHDQYGYDQGDHDPNGSAAQNANHPGDDMQHGGF